MTEVKIYWKLLDSVRNHWQLLVKINVNHWKDLAELEMFWKLSDTVRNHWQFLVDNNVQIWTYFDILTSDLNFAILKSQVGLFSNLDSEHLQISIPNNWNLKFLPSCMLLLAWECNMGTPLLLFLLSGSQLGVLSIWVKFLRAYRAWKWCHIFSFFGQCFRQFRVLESQEMKYFLKKY